MNLNLSQKNSNTETIAILHFCTTHLVLFGSVWSSVLLLCDQTSLGTYILVYTNCSVFCDVQHVQSSILSQIVMFRKFDVQTFNVHSVRSSVFWCFFQDYLISKTKKTSTYFINGKVEIYIKLVWSLETKEEPIFWAVASVTSSPLMLLKM